MATPAPPPPSSLYGNPIAFSLFSSLVQRIGAVPAIRKGARRSIGPTTKQHRLLDAWIGAVKAEYGRDLPEGTIVLFFRLFFPDEGVRRRYDLRELLLGQALEGVYGARRGTFSSWNAQSDVGRASSTGCLGTEVQNWLERDEKHAKGKKELTLGRVDELLDELATLSSASAADVQALRIARRRPVKAILSDLLLSLSPSDAAVMVQIILRDLAPLLYPPPSSSADIALSSYCLTSYGFVGLADAMQVWHEGLPRLYRTVADLDWVSWTAELAIRHGTALPRSRPQIGLPIKVPETEKPSSCARATKHLDGLVAVETKYDGERLQIHVHLSLPPPQQIRIFSKSSRDSTETRRGLLPIIRASLGLPLDPVTQALHPQLYKRLLHVLSGTASACPPIPPTKLVIEGEMVPYHEGRRQIDEFWKLGFAKAGGDAPLDAQSAKWTTRRRAAEEDDSFTTGATPSPNKPMQQQSPGSAQAAGEGDALVGSNLHLMIVWFDVLVMDGESLLDQPYQARRARLESLVLPIEGFSMLADSVIVDFDYTEKAVSKLRDRFANIIASRCEGLMLKPLNSAYNDLRCGQRWVKLKKDFIPGAGDTMDVCVVGASWQRKRGRELLVPPSVYTTFFVGFRADDLRASLPNSRKRHYHILFSTSYGLSREQLAQVCFEAREGRPERFDFESAADGSAFKRVDRRKTLGPYAVYDAACCSFTFSLAEHLYSNTVRPAVIFRQPRVMELNGAGFQRTPGCPYYELRWPRIIKASRPDESGTPLSLADLQRVAHEATGTVSSSAAALVDQIWNAAKLDARKKESPEEEYEREVKMWVRKLERADGIMRDPVEPEEAVVELSKTVSSPLKRSTSVGGRIPPVKSDKARPATPAPAQPFPVADDGDTRSAGLKPPPATPPRPRGSVAMGRSVSSPCARSDAPSPPAQALCPPVATIDPEKLPLRRRTIAQAGVIVAEPSASSNNRKRRRLSSKFADKSARQLQSFASLPLSLYAVLSPHREAAQLDTSSRAWSLYPPLSPGTVVPAPRNPHLDLSNYIARATELLVAAGLASATDSATSKTGRDESLRQGVIFVSPGPTSEDFVRRLELDACRAKQVAGQKATVWVLKREALETRGGCDLGMGSDVLTVL
ncbi:ATP dependent DNA ligase [Rhodotorula toruloides]|uniref:ATP dependent DNA ligase n=1 Tax=Rhodotorula toruloides TaxID=5286 RepID=A0A511KBJ7_RHOTO|nr:ATP dependent DNA ligase [Rhodotorula toruloides]